MIPKILFLYFSNIQNIFCFLILTLVCYLQMSQCKSAQMFTIDVNAMVTNMYIVNEQDLVNTHHKKPK